MNNNFVELPNSPTVIGTSIGTGYQKYVTNTNRVLEEEPDTCDGENLHPMVKSSERALNDIIIKDRINLRFNIKRLSSDYEPDYLDVLQDISNFLKNKYKYTIHNFNFEVNKNWK